MESMNDSKYFTFSYDLPRLIGEGHLSFINQKVSFFFINLKINFFPEKISISTKFFDVFASAEG